MLSTLCKVGVLRHSWRLSKSKSLPWDLYYVNNSVVVPHNPVKLRWECLLRLRSAQGATTKIILKSHVESILQEKLILPYHSSNLSFKVINERGMFHQIPFIFIPPFPSKTNERTSMTSLIMIKRLTSDCFMFIP